MENKRRIWWRSSIVEKSFNGTSFFGIGSLRSKGGFFAEYSFNDLNRTSTRIFYRIRSVDIDGTVAYSNTVSVLPSIASIAVFPNPFSNVLNIYTPKSDGFLQVITSTGKIILAEKFSGNHIRLNCGSWAKGHYHVCVKDQNGQPIAERNVLKQQVLHTIPA